MQQERPVQSLLITLARPPNIFLNREIPIDLPVAMNTQTLCGPGFPPWPSCADILVREETKEFVGVSYFIDEASRIGIGQLCRKLDSPVLQYQMETRPEWVGAERPHVHSLDIVWSADEPDGLIIAQLDTCFWYYLCDDPKTAIAIEVASLPETLREYGLRLPAAFRFAVNADIKLGAS